MSTRRGFLREALAGAGILASARALSGREREMSREPEEQRSHGIDEFSHGRNSSVPVQTPDVPILRHEKDGEVKVFKLVAEPVRRKIAPWKTIDCWGFNGVTPGPAIQADEGDRLRILVENRLPESLAIHWHGLEIPYAMDGMPYLSQKPIAPGSRLSYEFTVHQNGTFFYHSHSPMQQMMGLVGMFILHPAQADTPVVDHDFGIVLQEWAVLPNNTVPNTANMEWNWLTFNGACSPMTTPLIVRLGSRVRVRFVNLGMDHHPIHLHGHTFAVTGSEAGRQAQTLWAPGNTVLVGVAQARDIEFVANNPGDWMLHCHLPHHMMNQMSSTVGPLTRRPGMPMGVSMENGMGMLDGTPGAPLGDDYGSSLGRGMGVGSTNDQPTTNGPLSQERAKQAVASTQDQKMPDMPGMQHTEM